MKHFLFALALVPSISLADSKPYLVKQFDAKVAYCTEAGHLDRTAYLPKSVAVRGTDGTVDVSLEVAFLVCARQGEQFAWAPRDPSLPSRRLSIDGVPIMTHLSNHEFVLTSSESRLLATQAIGSAPVQEARLGFRSSLALSDSQRDALRAGREVKVRTEFFTRAIVTDVYRGEEHKLGLRAGGVYTLMFTLRQGGDGSIDVIDAGLLR